METKEAKPKGKEYNLPDGDGLAECRSAFARSRMNGILV